MRPITGDWVQEGTFLVSQAWAWVITQRPLPAKEVRIIEIIFPTGIATQNSWMNEQNTNWTIEHFVNFDTYWGEHYNNFEAGGWIKEVLVEDITVFLNWT